MVLDRLKVADHSSRTSEYDEETRADIECSPGASLETQGKLDFELSRQSRTIFFST